MTDALQVKNSRAFVTESSSEEKLSTAIDRAGLAVLQSASCCVRAKGSSCRSLMPPLNPVVGFASL